MKTLALLALLGAVGPSLARAECRASAGGQHSAAITLSPRAGVLCLHNVALHRGGECGGERLWTIELGCNETRRMAVTDAGALVSLLARRASRRDWEILRVFVPGEDHLDVRSVRLRELPGIPTTARTPRLSIDASRVRVAVEPELVIDVASIGALGRVVARRPIHR